MPRLDLRGARPPADEVLAAAVERSGEYNTARMRIRTVRTTPELGTFIATDEGVSGGDRGWFTMTFASAGEEPSEAELRFVDGIAYERFEAYKVVYDTDADWISADLEAACPGRSTCRIRSCRPWRDRAR